MCMFLLHLNLVPSLVEPHRKVQHPTPCAEHHFDSLWPVIHLYYICIFFFCLFSILLEIGFERIHLYVHVVNADENQS